MRTSRRGSLFFRAGIVGFLSVIGVRSAVAADSAGANTATGDTTLPTSTPSVDTAVPERATLMTLLEKAGVGEKMEDAGVYIYGHVEGGYTNQFLNPNDTIVGRSFDYISGRPLLNQAAISVERTIDVATDHFDIGFRVQAMEGTDPFVYASYKSLEGAPAAIEPGNDRLFNVGGTNSSYQFDIPDAYVDFGLPLGRGVRVRAGRFEFFKPINPDARLFYSTTYVYAFVLPYTNTGVTVAYDFSDDAGIELGFSRGYDVTVTDTNGSVDFIGKAHFKLSPSTKVLVTSSVGPEIFRDSHDYSALVDATLQQQFSKNVSLGLDGVYAYQFGNGFTPTGAAYKPFAGSAGTLPASYYGVSGVLAVKTNSYLALGGRLEWFRDDGGLLTGSRISLYEATIGATVTPFPHDALGQNLKLRPEVRFDYANRNAFGQDSDGQATRKQQLTFGVDVIYNF